MIGPTDLLECRFVRFRPANERSPAGRRPAGFHERVTHESPQAREVLLNGDLQSSRSVSSMSRPQATILELGAVYAGHGPSYCLIMWTTIRALLAHRTRSSGSGPPSFSSSSPAKKAIVVFHVKKVLAISTLHHHFPRNDQYLTPRGLRSRASRFSVVLYDS